MWNLDTFPSQSIVIWFGVWKNSDFGDFFFFTVSKKKLVLNIA